MPEESEKSAIERLKSALYARARPKEESPQGFYEREFSVPEEWNENIPVVETAPPDFSRPKHFLNAPFMKKFFIISLAFFIIALAFFFFVILRGSNIVSTRNVEILVLGPTSVKAGEKVSLQVSVENKNNTSLEFADLVIEYPQGTRVPENLETELTRFRKSLGTIAPRKTATENIEAVLFGQEGDEKEIAITLEYRTEGSNAIFVAEKKYAIAISASPFALSASAPKEVTAKQEFSLEVLVSSRAAEAIQDVLVVVDYPFGFSFTSASPEPSSGNNTWFLGDLPKGGRRAITISGVLEGQDNEEKVFRIESGLAQGAELRTMGVVYGTFLQSVRVARPSLNASLTLNGSSAEEIAVPAGERVNAEITLANNTPTKIQDVRAEITFNGEVLKKTSVNASGGFYRSAENKIIWDKNTRANLAELSPGDSIILSFSFTPASPLRDGSRIKNPVILVGLEASGEHLSSGGVLENVRADASLSAKVNSETDLTQRGTRSSGPFTNTGPIPPKAETESTYTILWTVVNTSNDLRDVSVSARLPAYMRWTGAISPAGENISYDAGERRVTWRVGDVIAWKGVASSPREAAFQVGLLPSVSQIGETPVLVGDALLKGFDEFTNAPVSSDDPAVSAELTTDPEFKSGDGRVVQ